MPTKVQAARMRLNIGGTTREAASFSYAVVAVDADGISIPGCAIVGASNWVTRNNRATNPASRGHVDARHRRRPRHPAMLATSPNGAFPEPPR